MNSSSDSDLILQTINEEFPNLGKITYLDHAGASLFAKSQLEGIHRELSENLLCNPHTNFGNSENVPDLNAKIRQARQEILRFFNTNEEKHCVIFTSGTTQALKIVAENFTYDRPKDENQTFIYLDECHTSVVGLREISPKYQIVKSENIQERLSQYKKGGLFTFPAMSNFNGQKFPMQTWIGIAHENNFKVMLDAASYVSTNFLDLSEIDADFICVSFYKIFGLPTGLGALISKNSSLEFLKKSYFGGGTVEMHLVNKSKHVGKMAEEQFEDGTLHYQGILAMKYGFELIKKFSGMREISKRTHHLAKYLYENMAALKYQNGSKVVEIYASNDYCDPNTQGGIVNFNIQHKDGKIFGFTEFRKIAIHCNLVVRVGCFCNIGSCQKYLGITDEDIELNHKAGHVCGDNIDVINNKPTGSIRISFGHYSTKNDADLVINIIKDHFMSNFDIVEKSWKISSRQKTISALYLYPIKSCAPMKITKGCWPLAETSLKYDRQFVIMHGRSTLTQKSESQLCQIYPDINLKEEILTLSVPWVTETCSLSLNLNSIEVKKRQLCSGKVCGDSINGIDCGDNVSNWLEDVLGLTGLRLIQVTQRKSKKVQNNLQSLANEAQFLVLNRSSAQSLLEESQENLEQNQNIDWILEQFRGNLVLDGCDPYDENVWKQIQIPVTTSAEETAVESNLNLEVHGLCTRCNVIGVNQANSERVQEPLQTLAKSESKRFKFGILAGSKISMEGFVLKIGSVVRTVS